MRVIAGEFRSRKLKSLEGLNTRPTPDRLRETLFNILAPRIAGKVFIDGYAGTGAVGIEALSRGARRAIFIERSRGATQIIHENLETLKIGSRAEVFTGKSLQVLERIDADILFLDPPYEMIREYGAALESAAAQKVEIAIAQHASRMELADRYGRLKKTRIVKQGDNSLTFFEPDSEDAGTE